MPPGMPAPMGGPMGAPSALPAPAAPPAVEMGGDGSYTICLTVQKDGTFQVYKESAVHESSEVSGEDLMGGESEDVMGGDKGDTYDNIEDALRGVVKLYRENPVGDNPTAQMKAGYGAEEGR